jgi:hypothetical protein
LKDILGWDGMGIENGRMVKIVASNKKVHQQIEK